MYINDIMKEHILNQEIDRIDLSLGGDAFILSNRNVLTIENKYTITNNDYKSLLRNKIIGVEQEDDKFIKFLLDNDRYIIIDMSDIGFEGYPEALSISVKNSKLWVIRNGDVVEF